MCELFITKSHSMSSVQGNDNNKSLSVVLTLTQGAKGSVRNTLGPQKEFRGWGLGIYIATAIRSTQMLFNELVYCSASLKEKIMLQAFGFQNIRDSEIF